MFEAILMTLIVKALEAALKDLGRSQADSRREVDALKSNPAFRQAVRELSSEFQDERDARMSGRKIAEDIASFIPVPSNTKNTLIAKIANYIKNR